MYIYLHTHTDTHNTCIGNHMASDSIIRFESVWHAVVVVVVRRRIHVV